MPSPPDIHAASDCRTSKERRFVLLRFVLRSLLCFSACSPHVWASEGAIELPDVVAQTQRKLVKVYGAGGLRGLEAYQSGFLISVDGIVLTAWTYVLDTDPVIVVMHDGHRYEARLLGVDPRLELALLQIDAEESDFFDLQQAVELAVGDTVLAFSNLYGVATGDEPLSVQRGIVAGIARLDARKGTYQTPHQGPVYVVDAVTNNAGAAGGAVTDRAGRLAAVIGKELRNSQSGVWLNYAVPIAELRASVAALRRGETVEQAADPAIEVAHPWSAGLAGIQLVPDVLPATPPYIEHVQSGSPASAAGLQPDDLITFVNGRLVRSQRELTERLEQLPEHEPLTLALVRDNELVSVTVAPQ